MIRNITSESKPQILNFTFGSTVDNWYKYFVSTHWQGQRGAKGRRRPLVRDTMKKARPSISTPAISSAWLAQDLYLHMNTPSKVYCCS